jgi:hypothetical protein
VITDEEFIAPNLEQVPPPGYMQYEQHA